MIALNLATPYALDEYEEGIELLHTRFPNRWGAIWALDEEVRSRGWKDVREKIINRSHVPSTPEWDPKHPWCYIIASSRYAAAGPLWFWWHARERALDKNSDPSGVLPRPALPASNSFQAPALLALADRHPTHPRKTDTPKAPQPPPPKAGQLQQLQKQDNKGKGGKNGKGGKAGKQGKGGADRGGQSPGMPGYTGCHVCGSPDHLGKDCPRGNQTQIDTPPPKRSKKEKKKDKRAGGGPSK